MLLPKDSIPFSEGLFRGMGRAELEVLNRLEDPAESMAERLVGIFALALIAVDGIVAEGCFGLEDCLAAAAAAVATEDTPALLPSWFDLSLLALPLALAMDAAVATDLFAAAVVVASAARVGAF